MKKTAKIQTPLGVGDINIAELTTESVKIDTLDVEELALHQKEDVKTQNCLLNKSKTAHFATINIDGHDIICEMSKRNPRAVIPEKMKNYVIKTLHSVGHPGIKESIHRIETIYYWDKMHTEISEYVKKCHQCLSTKPSHQAVPHIGQFDVPEERFSHLVVDIIELPISEEGHKFCFTVVCRTTRYFSAYAMKTATADNCMRGLLDFIGHFGVPKFLSSDSGTQFLSNIWKRLESTLGIDLKRGPLYRPQAVGMVERSHATFKTALKAQILDFATKNQKIWPDLLPWALLSMRASYRSDIEASPSELAHGLKPSLPASLIIDPTPSPSLQELLKTVKSRTNKKAVQTVINKENPIVQEPPHDVTHAYTLQHDKKGLDPSYRGPFKIKNRVSRSTVKLIVGHYANGSERYEDRHWSQIKAVKLPTGIQEDSRAKLGRPIKSTDTGSEPVKISTPTKTTGPPNKPFSQETFTGFKPNEVKPKVDIFKNCDWSKWQDAFDTVSSIDFSKPPPSLTPWVASIKDLKEINKSITTRHS